MTIDRAKLAELRERMMDHDVDEEDRAVVLLTASELDDLLTIAERVCQSELAPRSVPPARPLTDREAAILALLHDAERYGLDLIGQVPGATRANIYVILADLCERGFVTSRVEPSEGKPEGWVPRRLYRAAAVAPGNEGGR